MGHKLIHSFELVNLQGWLIKKIIKSNFQEGVRGNAKNLTISIILRFQGELGAGAAGTVYRVKHKTEGGEVFILFYTAVFVHFGICIFNVVFVCFSYLYTT